MNAALNSGIIQTMLALAMDLDKFNTGIEYINWADPSEPPPTP